MSGGVDLAGLEQFLVRLGAALLAGGEPVTTVEENLRAIAAAYGATDARVAATPTGVFLAAAPGRAVLLEPVGPPLRFDQTAALAELVRAAERAELHPGGGTARLEEIARLRPRFPLVVRTAALMLIAAAIALLLQTEPRNVLLCAVLGLGVGLLELAGRTRPTVRILVPVLSAFGVTAVIFLAARHGLVTQPLRSLLPPIAVLLPGAALTTAMIELAAGAMVAGTARLVAAAVQLCLIAAGILAGAGLVAPDGAVALGDPPTGALPPAAALLGLLLLGVGVHLNLSAPAWSLPWMWLVLLLAYAAALAGRALLGGDFGSFAGAVTAALSASLIERARRGPPALITFLPAFWMLVPGSLSAGAITQLASPDRRSGVENAAAAATTVTAVALGVLVGSAASRSVRRTWRRLRRGRKLRP